MRRSEFNPWQTPGLAVVTVGLTAMGLTVGVATHSHKGSIWTPAVLALMAFWGLCVVIGLYFAFASPFDLPTPPTRPEIKARNEARAKADAALTVTLEKFQAALLEFERRTERELDQGYRTNRHFMLTQYLRRMPITLIGGRLSPALQSVRDLAIADEAAAQEALNSEAEFGRHWSELTETDRDRLRLMIGALREARESLTQELDRRRMLAPSHRLAFGRALGRAARALRGRREV
jgi:hypothetical protein